MNAQKRSGQVGLSALNDAWEHDAKGTGGANVLIVREADLAASRAKPVGVRLLTALSVPLTW